MRGRTDIARGWGVVAVLLGFVLICVRAGEDPVFHPHVKVSFGPFSYDDIVNRHGHHKRSTSSFEQALTWDQVRATYDFAYNATGGAGKTIAIVDAYGASTAEADLATFSTKNGLPSCTTANGCFKKVSQTGGTTFPADDSDWGMEVALDVQTAHAIAPGAKILLVVASSTSSADLFAAVSYAAAHANYVSMSWGGSEGSWVSQYDTRYFSGSPSVAFFASTGDNGAGVEFPSSSPHVVAVGGTGVNVTSSGAFSSEHGWSGSGGGCSAYFTAPTVQSSNSGYSTLGCSGKRAVPDASMDADPESGVIVYYSYQCSSPPNCYYQVGGTSLAAPLFAARAALLGAVVNVTYAYGSHMQYRDVTSGNNGRYSCKTGLDLVTGLGTWIGTK